jgi:wyosine [tRNA(Phe)-imidazoG37] synthetase (radical SAM superfamily)
LIATIMPDTPLNIAFREHGRKWRENFYCYPVVSRRSGGLSIGINLNPDKACNFDCIYCQVDRKTPPATRKVDLSLLTGELEHLVDLALDQSLFNDPPFNGIAPGQRLIRDIAFSGDGEPTTFSGFVDAVQIAADIRRRRNLVDTKLVLITDACYLSRPNVREGLLLLDANNGDIWAKLDAGTEAYYRLVNRPNYPLATILGNILDAARVRPLTLQSLWMRVHGAPPPKEEVIAYCDRINEMIAQGAKFGLIQLYTIARQTTEAYATMLRDEELDQLAEIVRSRVKVPVAVYYGV